MESEGPRVMECKGPNRSGRYNGTDGAEQTKKRRDRGGGGGEKKSEGGRGGGGESDPEVEGENVGLEEIRHSLWVRWLQFKGTRSLYPPVEVLRVKLEGAARVPAEVWVEETRGVAVPDDALLPSFGLSTDL